MTPEEKKFAKALSKAGWHTYRDEFTGRVVTNAYPDERMKLQRICGVALEIVEHGFETSLGMTCVRIGPARKPA